MNTQKIVIGDGSLAIYRKPQPAISEGGRMATHAELFTANLGKPFPWGTLPHDSNAPLLWKDRRVGYGGLIHHQWFVTSDGRFGGADNVPTTGPGALRNSLLINGGCGSEAENEGYAVVVQTDDATRHMYHKVQLHALAHVAADGGHIIVSPIQNGVVYVGFVGRCQHCPNAKDISFKQLQAALPDFDFKLFLEWENWGISSISQAA